VTLFSEDGEPVDEPIVIRSAVAQVCDDNSDVLAMKATMLISSLYLE
jgi:hypothetical protein